MILNSQPVTVPATVSDSGSSLNAVQANMAAFGTVLQQVSSSSTPVDGPVQSLSQEQTAILEDVVKILNMQGLSDLEGGQAFGRDILLGDESVQTHPFLQKLLNTEESDDGSLEKLLSSLKEEGVLKEDELESDQTQLFALHVPELLNIVQALMKLDEKQFETIDLKAASNVLKLAKIQELLSAYKDMGSDQAGFQKELKDLLTSIAGKLQQMLESKKAVEKTGSGFVRGGDSKGLDILKGIYTRISGEVNQNQPTPEKKVGNSNGAAINGQGNMNIQMTKLEQFVLTVEKNGPGQTVNQEQFIKAFENILNKAQFSNSNGIQKLFLKLNPENLGSLRIEIIQKDAMLTARIIATTSQAKDLLDNNLQGLKHAFSGQNIQIEKLEISQAMNSFSQERFLQRDSNNPQQQSQSNHNKSDEQNETDVNEFNESFEEALLNLEV
jgi:flagellar hook-length control protein FliK